MSTFVLLITIAFIKFHLRHRNSRKKSQVRHVYIYCYLHLSLDCLLNNEAWISLFLLCCLSAFMPKAVAEAGPMWLGEMIQILNKNNLSTFVNSETTLYTPEIPGNELCYNASLNCFFLEMHVYFFEHEEDISLSILEDYITEIKPVVHAGCKECEEFTESNCETFLNKFLVFLEFLKYKSF
ncbi:interleukin-15-like [Acipenser ruthenus]|uniref:interleukin-15-like n=1 Tax=Acipenser ruthenus TaxID=7906 RepID=UPI001560323A|nr:interleukin-15-like [Acipenser ruthenus]